MKAFLKNSLKKPVLAGVAAVLLASVCAFGAIPEKTVFANSANKNWDGAPSSGMMLTGENCPVVVESETLTFNVGAFPEYYYYEQKDFDEYDASVTARYNFYNPASYDADMTLVFPFGSLPYYIGEHLDESGKYSVTADGSKAESCVRHTFFTGGYFEAKNEIKKISDDYKKDDFYSPDTPVHYYTLKFSGIDAGGGKSLSLYLKSKHDAGKTEIFYGEHGTAFSEAPYALYRYAGGINGVTSVSDGSVVYLFVVGDDFEDGTPKLSLDSPYDLFDKTAFDVAVEKEEITFKDMMLAFYNEDFGVSELDWYNASFDYLGHFGYLHYTLYNSLMRWFEYKLSVPAGGRLVNEVTAPLYPDISGYYSPQKYYYLYLLSPAKSWASFGSLDIVINTPYYLTDAGYNFNFEKFDGGYKLHSDGLPDGELTFGLCAAKNPARVEDNSFFDALAIAGAVIGGIVLGLQTLVAVVLCIVFAATGQFGSKSKGKGRDNRYGKL